MTAKELQIGDWVNIVPEEERDKTLQVQVDRIIPHNYNRLTIGKGNLHSHYDLITPIPLTKEMLVNDEYYIAEEASHNAVLKKKTDDALIVVLIIGNSFVLNIERNIEFEGTYATDSVHKCGYFVHEYQHALRICGLNELADGFKIE